jgi:hypothetical protein
MFHDLTAMKNGIFANHVLLVRPKTFHSNPETAADNHFQKKGHGEEYAAQANRELDGLLAALGNHGIATTVFEITDNLDTPDAIFPNNWFSTHRTGELVLYPMKAANRRTERRIEIIRFLEQEFDKTFDMSGFEDSGRYLEGTGSLVLDRKNRVAFAALSERTDPSLLRTWCKTLGYYPVLFTAVDGNGRPVYHTNVVMNIGNGFAAAALENIPDENERREVLQRLTEGGRRLVQLTGKQLESFAGNGLQLSSEAGQPVYLLSSTGWRSLEVHQQSLISECTAVITPDLSVIEQTGGGSARCMVAELFLQK